MTEEFEEFEGFEEFEELRERSVFRVVVSKFFLRLE